MSVAEAQIRNLVEHDPVFSALSDVQKNDLQRQLTDLVIPDTTVYRIIVGGVFLALMACIAIIGWSVVDGANNDTGLTAAIAVATGCFGGLVGALAPQKS
ncbi:MAG: hypothetical protein AB7G88_11715 [Thermomicrobiales bacterium]